VLGLVPKAAAPAGVTYTGGVDMFSAPPSAAPFAAVGARYATAAFVTSGWVLIASRISGIADMTRLLARAANLSPAGVVVHYVGHGSTSAAGFPVWSCRGTSAVNLQWTDPTGVKIAGAIQRPDENVVVEEILVSDVQNAMTQVFPAVPLTLITDACDNQPVLNLAGPGFCVIDCDSGATRLVNEGDFTTAWATAATPTCFAPDDVPVNGRPVAIAAVNTWLATRPAAAGTGPQTAATAP
jgi:hypothetical protein